MKELIDPAAAESADGPMLIAVARTQATERVTPAHSHGRGQLLGALDGLVSVVTGNACHVVPAVSAVWIPPHHPHGLRSHGPFRGWSLHVAEPACVPLPREIVALRLTGLLREAVNRALRWRGDRRNDPAD